MANYARGCLGALLCLAWMTLGGPRLATAQSAPAAVKPPATPALMSLPPGQGRRMTEMGFGIFQQRCLACHGNTAYERAPAPATLREMSPERIYDALTTGVMKSVIGDSMTDDERRAVAESVSGRFLGAEASGAAEAMPNRCPSNPIIRSLDGPSWNGWGNGLENLRYQPGHTAKLRAKDVPRLTLKWAFGYPDGTSAYGQPSVVAGRVFVGTDTGYVYSLDAQSGCVYWSYLSKASVRNAMTVGPFAGGGARYAVYFGDLKANVYAIDAQTGKQLWIKHVDDHLTARVTAAPALYQGRLYVPLSSWEEFSARSLDYPCCTSVGNVNALDTSTGETLWKTYVIPHRAQATHQNSKGVQQWAPAGGSVWNTPTIDTKRGVLYIGTGDATTYPAAATSDAVMALDLKSGSIRWSQQIHAKDSFLVGCRGEGVTENCPKTQGPDWDIPMSPMLTKNSHGAAQLVVGTKPGDIVALDPEMQGKVIWRTDVMGEQIAGDGPLPMPRGGRGPLWSGAVDKDHVYFGLNAGGAAALRLDDGTRTWYTPLNSTASTRITHTAGDTVIPDVLFVGGSDGRLSALSTKDGHPLWSFETKQEFHTVNGVAAHGGSISAGGPIVADGMVFVGSGFGVVVGEPGNVLLAFSAK